MAAPPSFVPSADEISTLASEIQETAQAYKASTEASPKLLQTLSSKSRTLNNLTTDPASRFLAVYYQGHQLATLNAASLMGLFSAIPPEPGSSASVSEIAQRTGAELSLTRRVTRALVAIEILTEAPATPSEEDRYAHTPLSQMFIMRGPNAMVQQMVCQMLRALTFLGDFFNANGLRAPFDGRNSLWACMVGKKNMDFWDVMATKDPKELQLVNETMSGIAQLVLPDVINAYDFGTLATGLDGRQAALVDCGGGRGHDLVAILERWPELKGKAVLQDLPQVVGDSTVAKPPDVDVQSWNFFKSEQPLKGTKPRISSLVGRNTDATAIHRSEGVHV